ncbi:2-polyprenyl-6-methoxyphenol hydroxylase-like FAD-dependent oxidoreductase [Hoeflea marina]|uniref:2-polyprenyl-6-methoxyphenol hydroxylase-like FAD-dependent oxidoreductase n=1 Tax=Hoeflea marina TaxID=274592 RepID=A0A317PEP4_9HYPH|nr:flavin-dependent oxidoreductase [Hoeflea marina]PWV98168.1 2-polyprenyl-6-methoxyphenol hydroxylase-like FAD-dependent oxidoreductase [Hoeflea marina]
MTLLIAGGGIAGLTLALTCHQIGMPVRVFEQVETPQPLGVGINLQPHAVRELHDLRLREELEAISVRTAEVAYFSKRGRPIWAEPRGLAAGYLWPQYSIHRGGLQMLLLDAVRRRLGPGAVVTGVRAAGFEQSADGVMLHLEDRHGNRRTEHGDMLVGADGIHSRIRLQIHPSEGPPIWGGAILWRATSQARPFLGGATMAMAGHEWQKFVAYPISAPDAGTGLAEINWIAELKRQPDAAWSREDWNRKGDLADFLPAFADWRFDWLDVPALIRSAKSVYEYPMVDRDPVDHWRDGRVSLIGDAAHPMYPIGSNGASQAILDGRVLGRCLVASGVSEAALIAYEEERRPATTRIVLANRVNGPDQVMQRVEELCGGEFDTIADVMSERELHDYAGHYKKLAGFDMEWLNRRPPLVAAGDRVAAGGAGGASAGGVAAAPSASGRP